mgnify:CR=1 FL=1
MSATKEKTPMDRLTAVGIFAASVVLTVLVWIRDRGLPVHIPLIASKKRRWNISILYKA